MSYFAHSDTEGHQQGRVYGTHHAGAGIWDNWDALSRGRYIGGISAHMICNAIVIARLDIKI